MINHGKNLVLTYPIISTTGKDFGFYTGKISKCHFSFSESTWRLYSEHQRTLRERAKAILIARGGFVPPVKTEFNGPPPVFDSKDRKPVKMSGNQIKILFPSQLTIFRNASRISSGYDAPRFSAGDATGNAAWNASNAWYAAWYASTGNDASWFSSWDAATWVSWYASRQ